MEPRPRRRLSVLEGDHVILRAIEESDAKILRDWNFNAATTEYFPSRWPVSMSEQQAWLQSQKTSTDKKKLLICDRESEAPIGLLGILAIDRANRHCEIGITIGEAKFRGGPHATEAMNLGLTFLFQELNLHLVYARIMEDNERARRFFKKIGFRESGILRDMIFKKGRYQSWVWVSQTRDEYLSTT